jgi:hypothetical protein
MSIISNIVYLSISMVLSKVMQILSMYHDGCDEVIGEPLMIWRLSEMATWVTLLVSLEMLIMSWFIHGILP